MSRLVSLLLAIHRSYGNLISLMKIKWGVFQVAVISVLLLGCTNWVQTKCMEKSYIETTR